MDPREGQEVEKKRDLLTKNCFIELDSSINFDLFCDTPGHYHFYPNRHSETEGECFLLFFKSFFPTFIVAFLPNRRLTSTYENIKARLQ